MKKCPKIKQIKESVNNKYDVRELYVINSKDFKQMRFPSKDSAKAFLSKIKKYGGCQ